MSRESPLQKLVEQYILDLMGKGRKKEEGIKNLGGKEGEGERDGMRGVLKGLNVFEIHYIKFSNN